MSEATVWDELPFEVLVHICRYLSAEDIGRIASVYSRWKQVAENRWAWRGKSYLYLSEGGQRLTHTLLVARALPVLKRVSVRRGVAFRAYLSGESADLEVADLSDEGVRSVISLLVPQNLSLDFCLLEEMSGNCLMVQPHCLEQLQVQHTPGNPQPEPMAKLSALITMLSQVPLMNLQSVAILPSYTLPDPIDSGDVMEISAALVTCPALEQLSIHASSLLSWNTVHEYSKLQFLELSDCVIDNISFLDFCPKLRNLSLAHCKPLRRRELSRKSELRSVVLRCLPVDTGVLDAMCLACPELESIVICNCQHITHMRPLRHCPRLTSVDVESTKYYEEKPNGSKCEFCQYRLYHEMAPPTFHDFDGLKMVPSKFQHFEGLKDLMSLQKLCLHYAGAEIDVRQLSEALLHMSQLEVLDVQLLRCVSDLSFLCHCRRLRSLTLVGRFSNAIVEAEELSLFDNLENLDMLEKLVVCEFNVHILNGILSKMPQLKDLYVSYSDVKCDFGFIRHCPRLTSLHVSFSNVEIWSFEGLRCLEQLRTLTLVIIPEEQLFPLKRLMMVGVPCCQFPSLRPQTMIDLPEEQLSSLVGVVKQMPQLEYLGLEEGGSNFLESWKFHKILSCLSSRTQY